MASSGVMFRRSCNALDGACAAPLGRASAAEGYVKVDAIGPETIWETALSGVDVVVHLAARARTTRIKMVTMTSAEK